MTFLGKNVPEVSCIFIHFSGVYLQVFYIHIHNGVVGYLYPGNLGLLKPEQFCLISFTTSNHSILYYAISLIVLRLVAFLILRICRNCLFIFVIILLKTTNGNKVTMYINMRIAGLHYICFLFKPKFR